MVKTYNVLLDTINPVSNPAFTINTNDLKTIQVNILINQDTDPIDLTGATVRLAVKKPDGKTVMQDCTIVDPLAGSCEIVLDTQAYAVAGDYAAEVMVYYTSDTVAVTGSFTYSAKKGILDDDTFESTNEYQSINQAIADANAVLDDLRTNGTGVDAQARDDIVTINSSLAERALQTDLILTNSNVSANTTAIIAKADKTYVDSQVAAVASGAPKGVYATLSALQTAFPTGNTNIYLVTADGKWYYWNGSAWTAGGTYQSTGIASGTVTFDKTNFVKLGKNLFNQNMITNNYTVSPTTGLLTSASGYSSSDFIPVTSGNQYAVNLAHSGAYYDANKNFVSGILYDGTNAGKPVTYTIPANAVYVRFTLYTSWAATYQFEAGTNATAYEPYSLKVDYLKPNDVSITESMLTNNSVTTDKMGDKTVTIDKTTFITPDVNIFNKNAPTTTGAYDGTQKIVTGKYIANNGSITSGTGYDYVMIPVTPGAILRFTFISNFYVSSNGNYFFGEVFNSSNQVSLILNAASNPQVIGNYVEYTLPGDAAYIYLNFTDVMKDQFMVVLNNIYPTTYVPFQYISNGFLMKPENIVGLSNVSAIQNEFNKYLLRNALCIGDSLTQGDYGTGVVHTENYPYFFAKLNDCTVENAGVMGWTTSDWWHNKGTTYSYANYDTAIIFLGTNGGLTDTLSADTASGSYNTYADTNTGNYCKIIESILAQNPNCHIFLVTRYVADSTTTTTNSVLTQIAAKYNLPLIDINTAMFSDATSVYHAISGNIHLGRIGYLNMAKIFSDNITSYIVSNYTKYNLIYS